VLSVGWKTQKIVNNYCDAKAISATVDKENMALDLKYLQSVMSVFFCAGCGSRRRFRESSPSNPEGPQVADDDKKAFVKSMPIYRQ